MLLDPRQQKRSGGVEMAVSSQYGQYRQSRSVHGYLGYLGKGGVALLLPALSLVSLLLFRVPLWIIGVVAAGYVCGALPIAALRLWRERKGKKQWVPVAAAGWYPGSRAPWVPASTEPFIGRAEQLRRIEVFLDQRGTANEPQTVIITGGPGTGKTSLAAQAALLAADRHPDGQVFVQFDARLDQAAAARAALGSLVADLHGSSDDLPYSLDRLNQAFATSTASKSLIIIADGITDPEFARSIMQAGPRCLVFITTEQLSAPPAGALPIRLDALELPAALEVLETKLGDDRIAKERVAAEAIVRAAGYNPLAIRLMGASIADGPYWSLQLAYEHITQRAKIPVTGTVSASDALSAALDRSYDRLAEDGRTAVALLALLDSPVFAPWMLAALLGYSPEATSKIIDSLLRAGLLERVSTDATGVPLFRARQQVLNFAQRKLLANTDESDRAERQASLARERQERHRRELSRSVTGDILNSQEKGDFTSALDRARDAIALAREQNDAAGESLALAALAEIQAELGYTSEADELAEAARRNGDQDSQPRALRVLGKVRRRWRQLEAADKHLQDGLRLAEANRDLPEMTRILREWAAVQAEGASPEAALATAERAVLAAADQPETGALLIAGSRWAEGRARLRLGQHELAAETLRHALADATAARQRMWQAWIHCELGRVEFARDDLARAQEHANHGLDLFAGMRHRYGVAYCRLLLGQIYAKRPGRSDASRLLAEAVDTFQNCGDPWIEAEATLVLAEVRASQDRSRDAIRLLDNAATAFADLDDHSSLGRVRLQRLKSMGQWVARRWRPASDGIGASRSHRR